MKCEIIKDLLPAYSDGVCSEETKKAIDEHLKECNECSDLLKVYQTDIHAADTTANKNAAKPFRKIKSRLFKSRIINITLASAIAILVAVGVGKFGYLAYGDIAKETDHKSFESLKFENTAKEIISDWTEGDIDCILRNSTPSYYYDLENSDEVAAVEEYRRNVLTEFYENYLKGKNIEIKTRNTGYTSTLDGDVILDSEINVKTDSNTFNFIIEEHSGEYKIMLLEITGDAEDYFNKLSSVLDFDSDFPIWERIYKESMNSEIHNLMTGLFIGETDDYSENLNNRITDFMNGMKCESFDINNFRFDKNAQNFLVDINMIFSDENGNRIVYTNTFIYYPYKYMIYPDSKPIIINDGVSDEKANQLYNLF
ncbi:MAG: zf-HC2 domain-containing protein [Oscillospiraceae bacterium]